MPHTNRRSAPGVRNGRVQKKNRWAGTPHYMTKTMPSLVVDRRRPGEGYRHVVRIPDVHRFIRLIPQWDELKEGLDAIVLDGHNDSCMGWYRQGVVAICAWEKEIVWDDCKESFFRQHISLFDKLAIPCETVNDQYIVHFTEESARAFLLIHVLVHELGHHRDLMTSRRHRCGRGEKFAENYARYHEDKIIRAYRREFNYCC